MGVVDTLGPEDHNSTLKRFKKGAHMQGNAVMIAGLSSVFPVTIAR